MKCYECGKGEYIAHDGRLEDGGLVIEAIKYRKCSACGDLMFPLESCDKYMDARRALGMNAEQRRQGNEKR